MTSSVDSPRFRKRGIGETIVVAGALCALVACAVAWFFSHGYILYYGDAQSHLNLSRSILDSRTPGYDQLGTVWLPVLHVICLPLVGNNTLWATGLAGAIPVALCFAIAGTFFYLSARDAYGSSLAAAVVLSCFALNPNLLYLASIPMTEIVFLAGLAVLLFAMFRFRRTGNWKLMALGLLASWWLSLTRYDGWFLIPFAGIAFAMFSRRRRWVVLLVFGAAASLAPLYWAGNSWWKTGDLLDFYSGPYSAAAIQGGAAYPGRGNWIVAAGYYAMAGQLCAGWALAGLGIAGAFCAARKRAMAPILFLLLTPAFYVWSMHSSGATPIYVPQLPPYSYYNTRYGIALVVFAAFAAGAIVLVLPARWKKAAIALPLISVAPWLLRPSQENWICWKESQVNSVARRAWTKAGADFLAAHYRLGQGIWTPSSSSDLAGILCRARIPLRETINVYNGPAWWANTLRPDLVHQAVWAVAQAGDPVSQAISHSRRSVYRVRLEIEVKGAPVLEIERR